MKSEWMARQDLRFNASLGSHQYNFVSLIGSDLSQGERRHQVAAGAAAGD